MAPLTTQSPDSSSGRNTPDSHIESILPVHPTAERRPYSIQVASENTSYSDEFITAKYTDRGASVEKLSGGQLKVTPTTKTYEFKTQLKVPKTGYISFCPN